MGQHVFSIIELSKKGAKSKIISLPNMTNTFVANYNFMRYTRLIQKFTILS